VVISVIALIMSILMPALTSAKASAKRLLCSTNLHSIGIALNTYQQENERIPPHYDRWGPARQTYDDRYLEPWVSYVSFHQDQAERNGDLSPLQLAYLYDQGNIENPEAFYCPSQPARGDNLPYTYDYYTQKGSVLWATSLPTKLNGSPDDKIRTSYHYWLHGKSSLNDLALKPVVFDNIQHWNSVAHTKSGNPYGVNALFGDGHVNFSNDPDIFELELWNGGPEAGPWDGPGNDRTLFTQILSRLRP
jgi:prepilin-type processing-associated H-X9-DG protein